MTSWEYIIKSIKEGEERNAKDYVVFLLANQYEEGYEDGKNKQHWTYNVLGKCENILDETVNK